MNRSIKLAMALMAAMWIGASGLWAQTVNVGAAEPYVVQKGDTASKIAKNHYGKAGLGALLWEANKNLVANPKRLTVGDTIYLFPEKTLKARKGTVVPPPAVAEPENLYERAKFLEMSYPKYFNFVADERGLGGSGTVRAKVKKSIVDAESGSPKNVEELFEIRHVGNIISSDEHPGYVYADGADKARYMGKTILSTNDDVVIHFTEDVARILDSDTYGESDPYFREFPIYGKVHNVRASINKDRVDKNKNLGTMYRYKGNVSIVARVEGLAPLEPKRSKALKKSGAKKNQGYEPVTYVARITSTVDAVELDDHIFLFVPLAPGPERMLEPTYVEPPDSYTSLGN